MRRRDFIAVLGAAAAAWPLIARAQQPDRMRRIGVMMGLAENDPGGRQEADSLRNGLQELGWTDGRNIRIDFHWGIGEPSRAQVVEKYIIEVQPDVIVSNSDPVTTAVFQLTKSIPIVFANVVDPVARGFISSYAHPGGNVTGFTNFEPSMGGKWVEVLKDSDAQIQRVAILFNPDWATETPRLLLPSFKAAGLALGIETVEAPVHDAAEIELAIDALAREPNSGLAAMPDNFTALNRTLIVRLALNHRLPLIAGFRSFTDEGALISYGISITDLFHGAASYVDRILKGEKVADLPVQAPTKFEMVINLKTAKAPSPWLVRCSRMPLRNCPSDCACVCLSDLAVD
jgi:putative tryptophan/tyrosine transport system substrate-binding protein